MNKALFLDRDGVINHDRGDIFTNEDFIFNEEIFDICREYSDNGFLIIVITNQARIAKGIYTEEDFLKLTSWMVEQFRNRGILISRVYYCPHHPDFTGPCSCRKPEPGMLMRAISEFDLDISECVLLGDKETDLEAGRRAGIQDENLHYYKAGEKGKNTDRVKD
ncbi:MAG TPA: HAD family hydrolase [Bacteroidales bacterium]|nr:HAD family hydrolase [Bacteroidales bacterium]